MSLFARDSRGHLGIGLSSQIQRKPIEKKNAVMDVPILAGRADDRMLSTTTADANECGYRQIGLVLRDAFHAAILQRICKVYADFSRLPSASSAESPV